MSPLVTPWKVGILVVVGVLASQIDRPRMAVKPECKTMSSINPQEIFEQFKEDFQSFRTCFREHCKVFLINTCKNSDVEYAHFYQTFAGATKFDPLNDEMLKVAAGAAEKGIFCYILNKNNNLVQVLITDTPEN